jgi:hypothetical protein
MSILRAVLVGALVPISVPVAAVAAPVEHVYEAVVPADRRAVALGDGWARSTDQSWITAGDQDGFHLLTADAADGYRWRTAATLSEPGIEADQWIGNACVTGSGDRAVVVYAPRTFTNNEALFDRGGFTAIVDLGTGAVRKLTVRTSLAYFNPGCGAGEDAVLTQATEEGGTKTRLLTVDGRTGAMRAPITVPGQLTSPVPTVKGIVAADRGAVVRVDGEGVRRVLAPAASVPFRLAADADGGVVYLERTRGGALARRVTLGGTVSTVARGPLTGLDVTSGRGGRVYVTGTGRDAGIKDAPSVRTLDVPAGSRVSTEGALAVTSVLRTGAADPRVPVARTARDVRIDARSLTTGAELTFAEVGTGAVNGRELSPSLQPAGGGSAGPRAMASDPADPADMADRYCSVPRNDPRNQAMQPKPRQVEWAVDQAVRGVLNVARPANWKNLGMSAYTPQTMFPPVPLNGGGYVPAQIMLGIAAQESNLWQAARFAVPGVTANPLIGNYYGVNIYNGTETDDWTIRFDHADCGYGVTQVTDGMRLLGREKDENDTARPYEEQRAIALDFAANVAAGLQILQRKWNQTREAGLYNNNGLSSKIENWYFAVWAYNSGFYPQAEAAANDDAWGVGWANNPANPKYPANRGSFLETDEYRNDYADAAHPQDWPYPEKVMGWAGHPVEVLEAPDTPIAGYRAAWWNGDSVTGPRNRHHVIPPHDMFCDFSNNCDFGATWLPDDPKVIGEPAGPCAHRNAAGRIDLKCWYHRPAGWKPDCVDTCGNELLRFDPGYAYQEDGTAYPPRCDLSGLPAGARVVDNLASWIPSVRPNCPRTANAGSFGFHFTENAAGQRPGKIDTHQLGMGFGGHFWMSNARTSTALEATGRWTFDQTFSGLAKIYVHLPQLHNGTTQARYHIKTQFGTRQSVVRQQGDGNRWIPIGTYMFNNVPEVSLSTVTLDGNGEQRVAWDAVALVPAAGMRTVKMLDWNVAGAADHFGDTSVIDRLVTEVLDRQPEVLTLNEVCQNQYNYLLDRLTDVGYQMAGTFAPAEAGNLWCAPGDPTALLNVGNVVLVRGTVTRTQKFIFGLDNKLAEDGLPIPEITKRSVACVTGRLPGADRDTKFCATHLEKGYPANQEAAVQARELARVFGPEARQMPLVIAGDTNIPTPPTDAGLGPLYGAPLGTGDFWEVEQERVCITESTCELFQGGQATYSDRKLDYVFASRWHLYVPIGRVVVNRDVGTCDGIPCSDHYLVHSQLILPTP